MNKSSKPNVKDVVSLIEKMGISEDRLKEIIEEYTEKLEKSNEQIKTDNPKNKVEVKKQEPAKTRKPKKQYKESKPKEKTEKKSENKLPEIYAGFATTKMQKIRQNYTKLYLRNNNQEVNKRETSEKDKQIIKVALQNLKVLNKHYLNSSDDEKSKLARKITHEAERIQELLPIINSIEELTEILAQLPRNSKSFRVSTIRGNVDAKLNSLRFETSKVKTSVVVSKNIVAVATAIASGILEIEDARKIIREETQKQLEASPKNNFSLSKKQHYNRVISQIGNLLNNEDGKYEIQNPIETIEKLSELLGSRIQSLEIVLQNLLIHKKYDIITRNLFIRTKKR